MKSIFLIILITFSLDSNLTNAQQTKSSQSYSEIDQLYKEYKNKNSISIYTSGNELTGEISIVLNADSLPVSIEISGTGARDNIAEVFYNLIKQKEAKGYSLYQGDDYDFAVHPKGKEYIAMLMDHFMNNSGFNTTYKKGNMFFSLSGTKNTQSFFDANSRYIESTSYTFSMINEDYSRKGSSKKTNFKF